MLKNLDRKKLEELGLEIESIINWTPNEKEKLFPICVSKLSIEILESLGRKRSALFAICLLITANDLMDDKNNEQLLKSLVKYVQ